MLHYMGKKHKYILLRVSINFIYFLLIHRGDVIFYFIFISREKRHHELYIKV